MNRVRYWAVEVKIEWRDPCQPVWTIACPAQTTTADTTWDDVALSDEVVNANHTDQIKGMAKSLVKRIYEQNINRWHNARAVKFHNVRSISKDEYQSLRSI